jgi:hypothetical protein
MWGGEEIGVSKAAEPRKIMPKAAEPRKFMPKAAEPRKYMPKAAKPPTKCLKPPPSKKIPKAGTNGDISNWSA